MLHVPYRGSGPLLTDLIGGQIQYSFDTMTAATPHVKSGKVIAIAQTRLKRAKAYPDRADDGTSLGFLGFEATTWYGLVGPGKLPSLYVRRMNEDVNKVLADARREGKARGGRRGGRGRHGSGFRAIHRDRNQEVEPGDQGRQGPVRRLSSNHTEGDKP